MGDGELALIKRVAEAFGEAFRIPCTGCNYCLPCPKNVNIPGAFAAYNMRCASGFMAGMQMYMVGVASFNPRVSRSPRNCVKCGRCEKQCPQHIPIMAELEAVRKRMEPFWLDAGIKIFNKLRS
jgi:predicted aldo/keto reductase-like oxidoreductase